MIQPRQHKRHPGAPDQVQGGGGDVGKRAACHVAEKEFLAHAVDDERGQRHGDAAVAHVVQQVAHRPGQGGDGANDEGTECCGHSAFGEGLVSVLPRA